jgi:DNA-binding response OmpR family regulator
MVSVDFERNNLLVVDDETMILRLMRDRLEHEKTYQCYFAESGNQALEICRDNDIDVVLTDVKMPGMDGIELMSHVREIPSDASFIVMSGYSGVEDVVTALRNGAVDFFQKPFKMERVLECLRRTFNRLNVEYSRQEAASYMVSESRIFKIGNDFSAASQVSLDMTRNLADRDLADEATAESIRVALNEMIINSIEHGNLEVSYEQKNELIDDLENYNHFLQERSQQPEYRGRMVEIENHTTHDTIKYVVRDQGHGFDHTNLPDPTHPENLLTCHGRGILMATIYMDEVTYNAKGNEVHLIKRRTPAPDSPCSRKPGRSIRSSPARRRER